MQGSIGPPTLRRWLAAGWSPSQGRTYLRGTL